MTASPSVTPFRTVRSVVGSRNIPPAVSTYANRTFAVALALGAILITGCGGQGVKLSDDDPTYRGAVLFAERCSGCHTLSIARAYGSKPAGEVNSKDRTNGPNFDVRGVDRAAALHAIRNGGFSGAIMPANVVVGAEADAVADFLARYSGRGESPKPGQ